MIVAIFTFLTGSICTRSRRGTKTDQLVLHIVCCDWHCHGTRDVSPGTAFWMFCSPSLCVFGNWQFCRLFLMFSATSITINANFAVYNTFCTQINWPSVFIQHTTISWLVFKPWIWCGSVSWIHLVLQRGWWYVYRKMGHNCLLPNPCLLTMR